MKYISGYQGVKTVKIFSKEEAYNAFKEKNKNNPQLINSLNLNGLPISIEIYLDTATTKILVAEVARQEKIVEEVVE